MSFNSVKNVNFYEFLLIKGLGKKKHFERFSIEINGS